ncbi:M20 family metallopeptidase [Nonomuraea cavernae]|uniref:Glutamate carboxypeptidase n=1 Tax=Nonomuraea cavernae TaxID=2045107 RepID=A0A918DL43_9ACTN|nr:M20 family metallopeptidase [Nonomuraea cavernae]MCA2187629.1 M20 family metallopeptidase [Nonomuraea cavernae]GGO70983.1 glutamate carboxypeptidase [Nonomuraea cavernae]
MIADLEELVSCESFSSDLEAVARSAKVVADLGARHLGVQPEFIVIDGVTHLRWTFGTPRVLLLGHHDTVWPIGSLLTHPWSVRDGVARGPGVFDMKAGLVQTFHALAGLGSLDGVSVLITGDEEVGSPTSAGLIQEAARGALAAFVMEASADGGALKTARKGTSLYTLQVYGKAAHAGLEPENGANAGVELAHQILAVATLGSGDTTVTPTVLSGGTTLNTVPAEAAVGVDVRAGSVAEQRRVDAAMRALRPAVPGTRLEVRGGPNRPPLEEAMSAGLYALAQELADGLGLAPLTSAAVGGASDGNFTAGAGCPTLDGLGAVGGGAHADHEHVIVSELPHRTALLRALVEAVRHGSAG